MKERRHFDMEFKLMAINLCYTGKTAMDKKTLALVLEKIKGL